MEAVYTKNLEQKTIKVDILTVTEPNQFEAVSSFCNKNGVITKEYPSMRWINTFSSSDIGTKVVTVLHFASEADLEEIIELGFKEGFSMAHSNLDELFTQ